MINGEVCVGYSPFTSRGTGNERARWNVYPVLFGLASGGGGNDFVTDLMG